jgi:hypothetical protein
LTIWLAGKSDELNIQAGCRVTITAKERAEYELRITAATFYLLWVNGEFCMYGRRAPRTAVIAWASFD